MKYLLAAVACLALASCASQRQLTPAKPPAEASSAVPNEGPAYTPSQLTEQPGVVVQPARSLLDKLTGRTPEPVRYPPGTPVVLGKKSVANIYNAPATVTTTTVGKKATAATAEGATAIAPAKKAGPVVLADSGAVVQVATTGKGSAAAAGRDAVATTEESGWPWWVYLLLAGGLSYAGYRGYKAFTTI